MPVRGLFEEAEAEGFVVDPVDGWRTLVMSSGWHGDWCGDVEWNVFDV